MNITTINYFLQRIGLFDYLKLFKDKYFENPIQFEYKKRIYAFYSQFIKPGNLCFDIGSNFGNRSETFLNLGAKVVAVEPQPFLVRFLRRKFKNKIILERKAAGAAPGEIEMYISKNHALSSLSSEWISKVKQGRFNNVEWDKSVMVQVTTLDELINKYGVPDFCKIDVEGYEFQVLQGLSRPIKLVSFEYTIPEFMEKAVDCVNYLNSIGKIECNYSPGETLKLYLDKWLPAQDFIPMFRQLDKKGIIDGDIYARFIP